MNFLKSLAVTLGKGACALLLSFLIVFVGGIGILVGISHLTGFGDIYETNSLSDYGRYTGNLDNEAPTAFITSFFPDHIDDSFSNVSYHYKAKKGDTYAYEAVLEFTVDDPDIFQAIRDQYAAPSDCVVFPYDSRYVEKTISDTFDINTFAATDEQRQNSDYPIDKAAFGKVLVSEADQSFIFVAIGVFDGGGTSTSELSYFLSRFQIDPTGLGQS